MPQGPTPGHLPCLGGPSRGAGEPQERVKAAWRGVAWRGSRRDRKIARPPLPPWGWEHRVAGCCPRGVWAQLAPVSKATPVTAPPPPPPRTHSPGQGAAGRSLGCGGRDGAGRPAGASHLHTESAVEQQHSPVPGSFCLELILPPPAGTRGRGPPLLQPPGQGHGGDAGGPSTSPQGRKPAQSGTERGTGTSLLRAPLCLWRQRS